MTPRAFVDWVQTLFMGFYGFRDLPLVINGSEREVHFLFLVSDIDVQTRPICIGKRWGQTEEKWVKSQSDEKASYGLKTCCLDVHHPGKIIVLFEQV